MDRKLLLGVFLPFFIIFVLVLLSTSDIGFSIEKETEKSVNFNSLFVSRKSIKKPSLSSGKCDDAICNFKVSAQDVFSGYDTNSKYAFNTGLFIEKGQTLTFSADGCWTCDYRNYKCNPDWISRGGCFAPNIGKLEGQIGSCHRFTIGKNAMITADCDGYLYLGMWELNFGSYFDNDGHVMVTLISDTDLSQNYKPTQEKGIIILQTIIITNDFFLPKRFELPKTIVCLNDKEGLKARENLQVNYSEGTYSKGSDVPIFDEIFFDAYTYSGKSIELLPYSKKQVKILVEPKYLYNYDRDINTYKEYDELLLIELEGSQIYFYNICGNLKEEDLAEAAHIDIVGGESVYTVGREPVTGIPDSCYDSDGGLNHYEYGYTETERDKVYDYCRNYSNGSTSGTLTEAACLSDGTPYQKNYVCPNGCKDGACLFLGSCIVRNSFTNLPYPNQPDVGEGYAKTHIYGIKDISKLKEKCSDEIFEELMKEYCKSNKEQVQWGVATHKSNTTGFSISTCAASGCEYHVCG